MAENDIELVLAQYSKEMAKKKMKGSKKELPMGSRL